MTGWRQRPRGRHLLPGSAWPWDGSAAGGLNLPRFQSKACLMTSRSHDDDRFLRGGRLTLVLAWLLAISAPYPAGAQLFGDRPPPVPPGLVPDVPTGPAISLAPPSGPAAAPSLPAPLGQPPIGAAAPAAPVMTPALAPAPGQGVLSLTARYGKDLPVISNGLVWRVFSDRPDESGTFKLIREDRGASPNIVLPPGSYVVHVAFGLVSAVRAVTLKPDTDREAFLLP